MFSAQDLLQFQQKGIELETINQQLTYFKQGFPFTKVIKAATIGDGILRIDVEEQKKLVADYERACQASRICKFVPASGAASRMFKAVFAFVDAAEGKSNQATLLEDHSAIKTLLAQLKDFAFYEDLEKSAQNAGTSIDNLMTKEDYATILKLLLTDLGLNYGKLPKGLLKFHDYTNESRTPVEEHLVEGANYCKNANGTIHLHFTVSKEHQAGFEALIGKEIEEYERNFAAKYFIEFSQQQPYTDTMAVDLENQPFREADDSILFRPGGHGALIENLNAIDADLVFIKNIDNVVPDRMKADTYQFKKVIGGVLVQMQAKIFGYLEKLDASNLDTAATFLEQTLNTVPPADYANWNIEQRLEYVRTKLNRPARVCGMVKNEGEPGGGPFWAENPDGTISLHIVESAQIDKDNTEQVALLKSSSHFNPVDLVCSMKDYKGEKFDLTEYVNTQQGFIALKSKNGRELKALELPGLWNGSMADWNTLFVEVPISTFNPVKTVNDLLRPAHQGN